MKTSILNDEIVDEIREMAASGFIQKSIAYALEIGTTTLSNWKRKGQDVNDRPRETWTVQDERYWNVYQALRKAINRQRIQALDKICEFETWQSAAWYLERTMKRQFSRPVPFNEEDLEIWLKDNFSQETVDRVLSLLETDDEDEQEIQDDTVEDATGEDGFFDPEGEPVVETEYTSLSDALFQSPQQRAAELEGNDSQRTV